MKEKWLNSLEPQIQKLREELRHHDPKWLAQRSGAMLHKLGDHVELRLPFFGQPYIISWPELVAKDAKGLIGSNLMQAMLLQYLLLADGTPIANHWVSLRELPEGTFYERAFQGYSGNLLARAFKDDLERFREVALKLGGEPLELGDAAFRFLALPRIPLAVVYWSGGGEFTSTVQVLFDETAHHYHHLEVLAHLGAMLCDRLIAYAKDE